MEQLTFGGFYTQNTDGDVRYTRQYGVTLDFRQKENQDTMRYIMKTTCVKQAEDWMWQVTLEKSDFCINDKKPSFFKERYDLAFGTTVLYPITVQVTPTGIAREITDIAYVQLMERFKVFKKKTLQETSGLDMEYYMHCLEKGISTKKKLLRYFMADWFWALYFSPMYSNPKEELMLPLQTEIPRAPYSGKIKEQEELSYYHTRQLTFKGQIPSAYFDPYPSMNHYNASIQLCYDFESDSGVLKHITAHQSITEKQTSLQDIKVSVYHVPENDSNNDTRDESNNSNETSAEPSAQNTTIQEILKWWSPKTKNK